MRINLPLFLYLLLAVLLWPGCDDDDDAPAETCDYDIPSLAYSVPAECQSNLVYLRDLGTEPTGRQPMLPLSCADTRPNGRTVELPAPSTNGLFLHFYNASRAIVKVEVFGMADCENVADVLLAGCNDNGAVAFRYAIQLPSTYDRIFVRIDYAASAAGERYAPYVADPDDYIAMAAFDGREPNNDRRLAYNENEQGGNFPDGGVTPPAAIPVSCDGNTLQRIILSSCSKDQEVKAWAAETGLEISEVYTGAGGCVVAVDVPRGMSPNTVGPTVGKRRPQQDTTGLFSSVDYLINLFNPTDPDDFAGNLERADPPNNEEILNCLAFEPGEGSTNGGENVVVAIIDSGVDLIGDNQAYWDRHRYRQPLQTEYLLTGNLGFDFLRRDFEPDDQSPHGTTVAGAITGGYRGPDPLTMVHLKIFGDQNAATYFGALVSIRQALAIESDIINMSWGFYDDVAPADLECLVQAATERGTYLVTTAGNENVDLNGMPQWPGSFAGDYPETVISTASYLYQNPVIDPNEVVKASYSNFGPPRASLAAFFTTQTPRYGVASFEYLQGTSVSAPIVTRVLATVVGPDRNRGDLGTFEAVLDGAAQLSGVTVKEQYLPVCEDGTGTLNARAISGESPPRR